MQRLPFASVLALCATLVLMPSLPSMAQIYSWTDEQGRRQVSDRPPEGAVKDLKVKGGRTPSGPQSVSPAPASAKTDEKRPQTLNEKALDYNKRQLEREENRAKQEKLDAEARERAQRCEQTQAYVRSLEAGQRATRLDPKTGERLYLDDKERERELAEARRSADSWCKPLPVPPPGTVRVPPPK
jgi:hypothetical protein